MATAGAAPAGLMARAGAAPAAPAIRVGLMARAGAAPAAPARAACAGSRAPAPGPRYAPGACRRKDSKRKGSNAQGFERARIRTRKGSKDSNARIRTRKDSRKDSNAQGFERAAVDTGVSVCGIRRISRACSSGGRWGFESRCAHWRIARSPWPCTLMAAPGFASSACGRRDVPSHPAS